MRYLPFLLLTGCCTPEEPTIKVVDNPEKDKYIAKLESEASDGASALSVASKNIEGKGKVLVELTQVRLAGIKQPSVVKVEEYVKALISPKLLDEERKRAANVQAEADRLHQEAERLDEENRDLRDTLEAEQKDRGMGRAEDEILFAVGHVRSGGCRPVRRIDVHGWQGKAGGILARHAFGIFRRCSLRNQGRR